MKANIKQGKKSNKHPNWKGKLKIYVSVMITVKQMPQCGCFKNKSDYIYRSITHIEALIISLSLLYHSYFVQTYMHFSSIKNPYTCEGCATVKSKSMLTVPSSYWKLSNIFSKESLLEMSAARLNKFVHTHHAVRGFQ